MKNYRIISSPKLLKGISLLGWVLIAVISIILFDTISVLSNIPIALGGTLPVTLFLYIYIRIKSDKNPDFLMIAYIRFTKIKKTSNAGNFKGNCYVS